MNNTITLDGIREPESKMSFGSSLQGEDKKHYDKIKEKIEKLKNKIEEFQKTKNVQKLSDYRNYIRNFRLFDISVPDVLAVILVSYGISIYIGQPFLLVLVIMFIIGIFIHRIVGVRTKIDRWLFHLPSDK